jgi:CHAT domain-containing protein
MLTFDANGARPDFTGTFNALAADPAIGRSEALRRAMTGLIAHGGRTARPALWAPFILNGEGRAER